MLAIANPPPGLADRLMLWCLIEQNHHFGAVSHDRLCLSLIKYPAENFTLVLQLLVCHLSRLRR
ncbi:MAG: hypothetical protein HC769_25045 [Cyanobacteria bacterium CRU_2_1]|nr:hypothetical protein [Cyanobacteria bacterium CRU_2_1]